MNCHECRQWIDDLLLRDPDETPPADIALHLEQCPECAREHALALETLEAITPGNLVVASPRLKERIMAAIPTATLDEAQEATGPRRAVHPWKRRAVRMRLAIALAAAVLLAIILFPIGSAPSLPPNGGGGPFDWLAQASAAEARLFEADGVVSVTGAIDVKPVEDPTLIEARWLPLATIGADGKTRLYQLKLGGKPGEGYTVRDETWYDPDTGRFAHVLSLKGRPVFANSYDGRSIHLLEVDGQGRTRIKEEPTAKGFEPPKHPSEFLGMFAALTGKRDRPDLKSVVRLDGPTTLADGTAAHVFRVSFHEGKANWSFEAYFLMTIRDEDHMVDSIAFVVRDQTLFTIRGARVTGRREPQCGWDLAGLRSAVEKQKKDGEKSPVQTLAGLVQTDLTVNDMVKQADYPVFIFGREPGWTTRRQIMTILDLPSPPHRILATIYFARDRRHIVLVQAHSFNERLGPRARAGKLVYTSPAGIKVWSDRDGQKMAEILLTSARAAALFSDPMAKDRTCYLLETPEGTFPALAVNGALTDAELHGLVDSLVLRAKPK